MRTSLATARMTAHVATCGSANAGSLTASRRRLLDQFSASLDSLGNVRGVVLLLLGLARLVHGLIRRFVLAVQQVLAILVKSARGGGLLHPGRSRGRRRSAPSATAAGMCGCAALQVTRRRFVASGQRH